MQKLFLLFLVPSIALTAQGQVSHDAQNRTALLEEFSAIHCGNCPAAHDLADQLIAAYPDQVIAAEVHGGSLAVPTSGEPELRNTASTTLWSFFGVASQPRGPVNRLSYNGQLVLSTTAWSNAVNDALQLPSPVNIGVASQFDEGTRNLTVNVELYYTADGTGGNDRISVFLKESHIIGYQQDYVNGPHAAYDHKDVLRAYITDLWGDEVVTNTSGTSVMRTYSFVVPSSWDVANCEVVAYVGEYQGEIYQARQVAAEGDATSISTRTEALFGAAYPVPANGLVHFQRTGAGIVRNVQVMDAAGRVEPVQWSTSEDNVTLGTTSLANGFYVYRASTTKGVQAGRFIVQH